MECLIVGYGNLGEGIKALELFKWMISEQSTQNRATFLSVLPACSYSRLSDQG